MLLNGGVFLGSYLFYVVFIRPFERFLVTALLATMGTLAPNTSNQTEPLLWAAKAIDTFVFLLYHVALSS